MDKVFITLDGKYYKSDQAKNDSDAEVNFPTQDQLTHLTETPVTELQLGMLVHKARRYA